jgi:hypothetical protein
MSLINMLGFSSSVHFAHITCYWKLLLKNYTEVLCQYRLYRAVHLSSALQYSNRYIGSARTTQKTQFYCRIAQTTQKTSHVIAKYCWSVTSLRQRGRVITEPLSRRGLHNPVVPLSVCVLLRSGCFCGSTILAWGKYATLLYQCLHIKWDFINIFLFHTISNSGAEIA